MVFDFFQNENCQEVNDFYNKLFNEIPDLIFEFVIAPDNTYLFPLVSRSANDFFELSATHFLDSDKTLIYERIVEQDRTPFFESLLQAKRNLTSWEFEFRVQLPQKGLRWLKIAAKPELYPDGSIAFYGRISDCTILKDNENRLKVSEERFKFALEASTAGVWDWNVATDEVFYSAQSMKILNEDVADVFDSPKRWDKIVHPDDLNRYFSDIQDHFDDRTPFYENHHRVLTSQGKYKWILDRGKVIERDLYGKPLRVIGTHTDISSQKEKELELEQAIDLVRKQNSRLLNFSHIVSHNLNTQAGNIKSILDLIDTDAEESTIQEMLPYLRTVSNDLNETIRNLVQLVSIQNNHNIPVSALNLKKYIVKTLDLIHSSQAQIPLKIDIQVPDYIEVDFNPAYLESVLLNFTTNAIKYADPKRPLEIIYKFEMENNQKVLSISDNGLGINLMKYGESLFGLYKTFHQHADARGLGLYITKNQIESMKGTVSVVSEEGVGSTFKIHFFD